MKKINKDLDMKKNNENETDDIFKLDRRQILINAMTASSGLALRSLLTGIPITFLTHRAMAAGEARYLVYSSSGSGDPMNANVPGTYMENFDHPAVWNDPVNINLGGTNYQGAAVWNDLNSEILANANFFHHRSNTNSHNELASVMTAFGAVRSSTGTQTEMIPSLVAQQNSARLATQIRTPLALGSILKFEGKNQKIYNPQGIKSLFPTNLADRQIAMRNFRTTQLDAVYRSIKQQGTSAQMKFLDQYALSEDKAKVLGESLATALASVNGNSDADDMRTAAALLALNVTPVVTVRIGFGGDNHGDTNLNSEVTQHRNAISTINTLYDALSSYNIQDRTTFAALNVFGRTPQRNNRGGRDHHGNSSVMFSFGPDVNAGVTGGLVVGGRRNRPEAQGINSVTGGIENPDINASVTLHSAAKSLLVASGVDSTKVDSLVLDGKVVQSYVK